MWLAGDHIQAGVLPDCSIDQVNTVMVILWTIFVKKLHCLLPGGGEEMSARSGSEPQSNSAHWDQTRLLNYSMVQYFLAAGAAHVQCIILYCHIVIGD